jgi:RNA polymerase-binding transcription factor DksA
MLKGYRLCASSRKVSDEHIVHTDGCSELDKVEELEYIGLCTSSHAAISEAQRRGYHQVKACNVCSHRWDPHVY